MANTFSERMFTMGEWLAEWVQVYKIPNLKPDSVRRLNDIIKNHVPQWLKEIPLSSVNAFNIDKAVSECKLSRSRKYLYQTLKSALKRAYCLDLISSAVHTKIESVKHRQHVGQALTLSEQEEFLKAITKSKYRYYFEFLLLTGCRRSEALALKWSDINEDLKEIYIHGTKTESSERTIFLLPAIGEVLAKQREKSTTGLFVFPYDKSNVTHVFKKYCPKHKLHDLRHTFVTRCAECGINIKVAQRLAGHSDINTTLQIYTHVTTDFERSEFEKFNIKK